MEKILQADLAGKGVIGLPDTPRLTAEEMQRKFEETAREVIVPKYNALVDELSGDSGAEGIGAKDPAGEKTTVQKELDELHKEVELAQETGEKAGEDAQTAALAATEAKTAAEEAKAAAEEANIIAEFKQLTAEQRETARNNIFAVSCEADQGLGPSLRYNARANIKAVSYEAAMPTTLTEEEKAQARANIGAAGANVEEAINAALEQAKASGEFDGEKGDPGEKGDDGAPGKDGVSATHKWEGTTLTITSASGTSSANLKGDKGDTGAQGAKGEDGQPGADGKSAYQYAVDAGYTGTEEEFAKVLASGGYAPETETVLSDNLLDKSLMTRGGVWYYGSSGLQLVTGSADSYYGYIPLRGAGTYRTKFQASVHSSTDKRIALVNDDNIFVTNVTGSHGDIPTDLTRNWLDFEFVVTQAHIDAGATRIAFDVFSGVDDEFYNRTMIVKDREYPSEFIPFGYIEVATDSGRKQNNVLCEKTAVFLGDSICAGTTVDADSPYYNYGWGGIIGEANRMNWKNYGKNGGTITHRGADNTCIAKIADTAIAEHPNADYVIFEGGCNDADQMKDAGLGEISADYATFDTTTFSGALEALILKLVTAYPHAKIGYIIPQKMYTGYADFTAANHIHRKYFDRAVEICQKWGIPVVDIWNGSMLNPKLSTASVYYSDGIQHLSEAGYLAITPMIEAWMRNMYVPGTAAGGSGGVTSWNDLTDKPFGDYGDNVVVLPKTEFVSGLMNDMLAAIGVTAEFVEGKAYTVNWNGVEYETVCFMGVNPVDSSPTLMVGNPAAIGGEDNNQPFIIGGDATGVAAAPLDGSTSAWVSIKGYGVEKLPPKYVPRARCDLFFDIDDFGENNDGTRLLSVTYDTTELVDAILNDHEIYVHLAAAMGVVMRAVPDVFAIFFTAGYSALEANLRVYVAQHGKQSVPIMTVFEHAGINFSIEMNMSGLG